MSSVFSFVSVKEKRGRVRTASSFAVIVSYNGTRGSREMEMQSFPVSRVTTCTNTSEICVKCWS